MVKTELRFGFPRTGCGQALGRHERHQPGHGLPPACQGQGAAHRQDPGPSVGSGPEAPPFSGAKKTAVVRAWRPPAVFLFSFFVLAFAGTLFGPMQEGDLPWFGDGR